MAVGRHRPWAASMDLRVVQVALGWAWILDGLLQLQPKMFGPAFASQVLQPAGAGQPAFVAWPLDEMARLVAGQPALVDAVFAGVQLLIGIGLLRRETVRPALVLSFCWATGVWWFGEGLGMLFTGAASPLTGAPGAVLLYGLIGVVVWPRREGAGAGSARRAGPILWAMLWLGMAVLWLLPANSDPSSISAALAGASASSPSWLAHVQTSLASGLQGDGVAVAAALAAASAVIGLGPLLTRHVTPFLVAGAALSIDFWMLGQSFGGIVTGLATDPNAGPLFVLLALALFPARPAGPAPALPGGAPARGAPAGGAPAGGL